MSEWQNRWLINGTLTTTSPLHIGGDLPCPMDLYPKADKKKKQTVDVTTVVSDYRGRAYIPGSTIKGNLRAWMETDGCNTALIKTIFGSDHKEKEGQIGGKAEFHDAFVTENMPDVIEHPPYWNIERLTGVTASVALNRTTGTAEDKKLFHLEYVPFGVSFSVRITGQDLDNAEVALLLYAIENGLGKEAKRPMAFGAFTANGWGRMIWNNTTVRRTAREDVMAWLETPADTRYDISTQFASDDPIQAANDHEPSSPDMLAIALKLNFDGPFLVNDQSKSKKVTGEDHDANFNPRRNTEGRVILPVESFRGAFRSQAERIIRTIHGHACTPQKPCAAITKQDDVKKLCLACQLFGASGWKTLIEIPQFILSNNPQDRTQEFLAIDRFTGGGKDGAKFNARVVVSPHFTGEIKIDVRRSKTWMFGLLALTLRDLCEGDITFGFGAAKGYGTCRTKITISGNSDFTWPPAPSDKLSGFVEELHKEIKKRGANHA